MCPCLLGPLAIIMFIEEISVRKPLIYIMLYMLWGYIVQVEFSRLTMRFDIVSPADSGGSGSVRVIFEIDLPSK